MKRSKYVYLLFFIPSLIFSQPMNKMVKAFRHEGVVADRLVFYFSNKPTCNYIPQKDENIQEGHIPIKKDGTAELEFFLPLTTIAKGETARFVENLGVLNNDLYRIKIEFDSVRKGLRCFVLFRPEEVGVQQELLNDLNNHPGIAFSFFKRNSLHKVNSARPIRQTAQLKKKHVWQ